MLDVLNHSLCQQAHDGVSHGPGHGLSAGGTVRQPTGQHPLVTGKADKVTLEAGGHGALGGRRQTGHSTFERSSAIKMSNFSALLVTSAIFAWFWIKPFSTGASQLLDSFTCVAAFIDLDGMGGQN